MSLFLVATPIGNLADISERAKQALIQAQIIAAEDTRSARRLLAALNIPLQGRELVSYGEHNEKQMAARLGPLLERGNRIALISEGGTPLISDPGYRLVQKALQAGAPVVPIPGPCAAIAALCASGLPVHAFLFRGFPPKKSGARGRLLKELAEREETLIFYESPQRVGAFLKDLADTMGAGRRACVARELTKFHETFLRGTLGDLAERLGQEASPNAPRGECTVLVAGMTEDEPEEPAEPPSAEPR